MQRAYSWLAAGALTLLAAGGALADKEEGRKRGTFQAERAGWMLGMYVGEEKGYPYPFVLQLDPKGDAKARGIREGDELIRFQDEEVRDLKYIFDKASKLKSGRMVNLWIRRGSQTLPFTVRVPKPETEDKSKEAEKPKAGTQPDLTPTGIPEEPAPEEGKKKKKKRVIVKPIPSEGDRKP